MMFQERAAAPEGVMHELDQQQQGDAADYAMVVRYLSSVSWPQCLNYECCSIIDVALFAWLDQG
jgi:hypothetical protein